MGLFPVAAPEHTLRYRSFGDLLRYGSVGVQYFHHAAPNLDDTNHELHQDVLRGNVAIERPLNGGSRTGPAPKKSIAISNNVY